MKNSVYCISMDMFNDMSALIKLPRAVEDAIHRLQSNGYEAYVVGGCVRDVLLKKTPSDWDITTSANPDEIIQLFQNFRIISTGVQHGTVTVLVDGLPLEITTYRVDGGYTDGRHPDKVIFTRNLADDLRRRDFTVNAMAYNPCVGLVDPYEGEKDLSARCIRCVGNPRERFTEDALRILRALRFAAVLGFNLEKHTAAAIHTLPHLLSHISAERIASEMKKLLLGPDVSTILQQFADVCGVLLPVVSANHYRQIATYIDRSPYSLHVRLALLFSLQDNAVAVANSALKRLRIDNCTIDAVSILLRHRASPLFDDVSLRRLFGHIGNDRMQDLLSFRIAMSSNPGEQKKLLAAWERINTIVKNGVCCSLRDLAINGNDLLAIGYPAGPAIGAELQRLLDTVIELRCDNNKETLLDLALKHKQT